MTTLFDAIKQISDEKENEIEKLQIDIFIKENEIRTLKEENIKLKNTNFRLKERLKKKSENNLIVQNITEEI